jgi:hypothetical protein
VRQIAEFDVERDGADGASGMVRIGQQGAQLSSAFSSTPAARRQRFKHTSPMKHCEPRSNGPMV